MFCNLLGAAGEECSSGVLPMLPPPSLTTLLSYLYSESDTLSTVAVVTGSLLHIFPHLLSISRVTILLKLRRMPALSTTPLPPSLPAVPGCAAAAPGNPSS